MASSDWGPEIVALLTKISKQVKEFMPEGMIEVLEFKVTDRTYAYIPKTPFFTVDFENLGPSTVYVSINRRGVNEKAIAAADDWYVYMGSAKIKKMYMRCLSGGTATVEVNAVV